MPSETQEIRVPGRVNLIGEHIDYHGLDVLPMAIGRSVRVKFRPRGDRRIQAHSAGPWGTRAFEWTGALSPVASGDWENYLRAAAQTVAGRWGAGVGVDAAIESDLPPAAGLSSSSALFVAFTLALLQANGLNPGVDELMEVLPEGERFVGTRGGAMDHAALLASRAGFASLIAFEPLAVRYIPVPPDWGFLVAHSLVAAEKSGSAREAYNARRQAGFTALSKLGFANYREALAAAPENLSPSLTADELAVFQHVTTEARRVSEAARAMERDDAEGFGALLVESHASLRHRLHVSCPALDRLVDAAMESGALGARLTGAGFGGCAVIFSRKPQLSTVRRGLIERFYAGQPAFREPGHLIEAQPAPGACLCPPSPAKS